MPLNYGRISTHLKWGSLQRLVFGMKHLARSDKKWPVRPVFLVPTSFWHTTSSIKEISKSTPQQTLLRSNDFWLCSQLQYLHEEIEYLCRHLHDKRRLLYADFISIFTFWRGWQPATRFAHQVILFLVCRVGYCSYCRIGFKIIDKFVKQPNAYIQFLMYERPYHDGCLSTTKKCHAASSQLVP